MAKYGMVLNVDRCIGCYTCVVACKMCYGTRPGVDYNGVAKVEWGEYPDAHQRFRLTMCMHCENAPCVAACPTKATTQTAEGAVIMDYDTCIGCGACIDACPYNQRHLVADDETNFEGTVLPCEEEAAARLNVVEKCIFCYTRAQSGGKPMCSIHCPSQCRVFGDVDDPESDISKYITATNAQKVEGTSIYYVIPAGMDRSLLPPSLPEALQIQQAAKATPPPAPTPVPAAAPAPEPSEPASGGGNSGGIIAGVAGVAALAGIGGYAYKKNKDKNAAAKKEENAVKDNTSGGDQ